MNVFQRISFNEIEKTHPCFGYAKISNLISTRNVLNATNAETNTFLHDEPRFSYLLACQYLYRKICGNEHGIHSNFAIDTQTGKRAVAVCKYLFKKVLLNQIKNANNEILWSIDVCGITDTGMRVAEKLSTPTIQELYIKPFLPRHNLQKGIYKVSCDAKNKIVIEDTDFISIMENRNFKYLDITSISLEQCTNNSIIAYIATNKPNVYLFVDEYQNKLFKILHWN